MNDLSLPRRFLKVSRNFGVAIAVKVTYSKIRGMLFPALALPDGRVYRDAPRQASFLVDAAQHDAVALKALVEIISANEGGRWEICICERLPMPSAMGPLLERLRGTQPWIRIVRTDPALDGTAAAQQVVEQATGQYIVLLAPHHVPGTEAIRSLIDRMDSDPEIDAAAVIGPDEAEFHLAAHRKSAYLACHSDQWPLTAPALAKRLREGIVRTAYLRAG